MSVKKRRVDDPGETGKIDVFRDLEERVLKDTSAPAPDSHNAPGQSIIRGALADRDTDLLRKIAAERKGLTDQQRRALMLMADLLDGAVNRRGSST